MKHCDCFCVIQKKLPVTSRLSLIGNLNKALGLPAVSEGLDLQNWL